MEANFWHGEMMFASTVKDENFWLKNAGLVVARLNQNDQKKLANAKYYSIEQFAVILYIETLFGKGNPYDSLEWIYKY